MMRSVLFGCLLLVAAVTLCYGGEYGVWLSDEVFIVDCCVTKLIPLDTTKLSNKKTTYDDYESPCNPEFCKAVTTAQEKLMTKIIENNKKKDKKTRANDFLRAHIRERLWKRTPSQVTVFMEDQGLIHNLKSKTRTQTENPGSNFWPKGIVPFKYAGDLAKAESSMDDDEKKVLATYKVAIAHWEEGTCINFEASGSATLKFDINKADDQAACTGAGSVATEVVIPSAGDMLDTTEHELGHVLGLEHTNQRSDFTTYLNWDHSSCYADFGTYMCDAAKISPFDIKVADEDCDTASDLPGSLKTKLGITGTYNKDTKDHRDKCRKHFCCEDWIKQYLPYNSMSVAGSKYEYASIMHYPVYPTIPLNCISLKSPKVDDTLGNGDPPGVAITDNDREVINRHYKCRKLSVTNPVDNKAKTVWVHPDMTLAEAAARITSRSGVAAPIGKKFELTVGSAKHELTGTATVGSVATDATFGTVFNVAVV